jgi:hypothetical protein
MFAIGMLSASLEETLVGWFRIKLGKLDQCIVLVAKPRHFGDHQWLLLMSGPRSAGA